MDKKVSLKSMRCPTCGGTLRAENENDKVVCLYCGNTSVPITEKEAAKAGSFGVGSGGKVRIEGLKTASSALAYTELLFEEYDWDSFAYMQSLTVEEVDNIAESLRYTSSDEKNTWILCFKAISVPFKKKAEGLKKVLESAIAEHKNYNLDAYSKFDTYKGNLSLLLKSLDSVKAKLIKYIEKAEKYGATEEEISAMKSEAVSCTENVSNFELYADIESVPEIKRFNEEKNAAIAKRLSDDKIDAEKEYQQAKALLDMNNHREALDILCKLCGYKDSYDLIRKINRLYEIADVMEVCGKLYYIEKKTSHKRLFMLKKTASSRQMLLWMKLKLS